MLRKWYALCVYVKLLRLWTKLFIWKFTDIWRSFVCNAFGLTKRRARRRCVWRAAGQRTACPLQAPTGQSPWLVVWPVGPSSKQVFGFCTFSLHFIRHVLSFCLCMATVNVCFCTKNSTYFPTSKPGREGAVVCTMDDGDQSAAFPWHVVRPRRPVSPSSFSDTLCIYCLG